MDIFNVLTMIGGLSLFLFGMSIMGSALERRAGKRLKGILAKMTTNRLAGFLAGCSITAVIQSSSATTVMVVGFVNSGLMDLRQAINVIMGANVGTTVTGWILSLSGIESSNMWIRLLKPSAFTPVLALIGIVLYMFGKRSKKRDTGVILLGFVTLMYGMETMSGAVIGLSELPAFQELFMMFRHPFLGLLTGAGLTAIIQSSSASVGILQALAFTGQVSYGAAIPIIMGQNIGTCVTAVISSIGANKNAKRAAFVHLSFNMMGSISLLLLLMLVKWFFAPAILDENVNSAGIALIHTIFNISCVILLMPISPLLEKLSVKMIRNVDEPEKTVELDNRLLFTPTLALARCQSVALEMAECSVRAMKNALMCVFCYTPELAEKIREDEDVCDHYEDSIGTYLVRLSSRRMGKEESEEAAGLLKVIGDFERISDHAVNILQSAEELREKGQILTENAVKELETMSAAIQEILDITYKSFMRYDVELAKKVAPLKQVIDMLKEKMRTSHILRMQDGRCSIAVGFVWSDLLTNLERTSAHCSNIAGCIIDVSEHNLNLHKTEKVTIDESAEYKSSFEEYLNKYSFNRK